MIDNKGLTIFSLVLFLLIFSTAPVFAVGETVRVGIFDNPPKVDIDENGSVS